VVQHDAQPQGSDTTMHGRVALVTGAARGIGRAVAGAIADAGGEVVALDVRPEVRDLESPSVTTFLADASSVDDMARVVGQVEAGGRRIDAVVANAGQAALTLLDAPLAEAADTFDRMWAGNARSAYVTVRAVMPHLLDAGAADVVLVSTDHVVPRPGSVPKTGPMEAYDAAKWALEGLRRNWAVTLGRHGVRVNSIGMGETDTPMLREFLAGRGVPAERIDEMSTGWMTAEQVAAVVLALLTEPRPGRTDAMIGLWPGFPVELPPLG
jgi:NAD(P)-dependent dehydrogenase (short-subunit alcohol dehydrogenase family)